MYKPTTRDSFEPSYVFECKCPKDREETRRDALRLDLAKILRVSPTGPLGRRILNRVIV